MPEGCPACGAAVESDGKACSDCGITLRDASSDEDHAAGVADFEAFADAWQFAIEPGALEPTGGSAQLPASETSLPDPAVVGVHAFFDAFVARLVAAAPATALRLGAHPHPVVSCEAAGEADAALGEICDEALARLDAWEGAAEPGAHDRLDARVLRAFCAAQRHVEEDADAATIESLHGECWVLTVLSDVECCPAPGRAAAAVAWLQALPRRVAAGLDELRTPARSAVLGLAMRWDGEGAGLLEYPSRWRGLDPATLRAVRKAANTAGEALLRASRRLRSDVLARATGAPGIGSVALSRRLRLVHGLPYGIRDAYRAALESLRSAEEDLGRLSALESPPEVVPHTGDLDLVRALHHASDSWVRDAPVEPGLRIATMPGGWAVGGNPGFFAGAGPLAESVAGAIYLDVPYAGWSAAEDTAEAARLRRRHLLAHETYPGHRLDALVRARACRVRQFAHDALATEGWAVYAEDLIHESGHCSDGPQDRWVRAADRRWRAIHAMADILYATNAASSSQILGLLGRAEADDASLATLGAWFANQGYGLGYELGLAELVRLRRIAEREQAGHLDLPAFHARLLCEGRVPARWIAEAWGLPAE